MKPAARSGNVRRAHALPLPGASVVATASEAQQNRARKVRACIRDAFSVRRLRAFRNAKLRAMAFDFKTLLDILTLAIVAASSVAALRQLQLNRSGNQLRAVLAIQSDFHDPDLQAAFMDVQSNLTARLGDATYRESLEIKGFIDPRLHPEVIVCNWFEGVGVTVKYQLVSEDAFMDLYGRLVAYYWDLTSPAIGLMRRTRGRTQYHNFEYLMIRARLWNERHPEGIFPRSHVRAPLEDVWGIESD